MLEKARRIFGKNSPEQRNWRRLTGLVFYLLMRLYVSSSYIIGIDLFFLQDALQESRGIIGQLLTLMDGAKKRGSVIVIGATNRPHGTAIK